jgi:hypothetical protein
MVGARRSALGLGLGLGLATGCRLLVGVASAAWDVLMWWSWPVCMDICLVMKGICNGWGGWVGTAASGGLS